MRQVLMEAGLKTATIPGLLLICYSLDVSSVVKPIQNSDTTFLKQASFKWADLAFKSLPIKYGRFLRAESNQYKIGLLLIRN